MQLDARTLYFMTVVVSSTVGLISTFYGLRTREYRSVRDWGIASVVISAGLALVTIRAFTNDMFGVLLADLLIVAGMALTYRSFLVYREEPTRDRFAWGLVAMTLAAVLLWKAGVISVGLRSAAVTGALALMMGRCAWLLSVKALPVARRSQFVTAGTYVLFAALQAARTLKAIFGQTDDVLAGKPIEIALIVGMAVLWISITLSVIWMVVERQHAELARLASRDPLTGALNRRAFVEEFERAQYRHSRTNRSFAVTMFDIDHFKRFNDMYGHQVGDEALRTLVGTLREVVRKSDAVGRYGGEEFIVLMPDAHKLVALEVAERARVAIERAGFTVDATKVSMTVSAGVAEYPKDGADWNSLVEAADAALYQAKASGRNRVCMALAGQSGNERIPRAQELSAAA